MAPNEIIDRAFAGQQTLQKRTYNAIAEYPKLEPLFVDIAKFIDVQSRQAVQNEANGDGHISKKRKLEVPHGDEAHGTAAIYADWNSNTYSSIKDLSFSIPLRKKLTLEIGKLKDQGVRARNLSTGGVEFGVSYKDIQHVVCLPVPEKPQAQYCFCLFPFHGDGVAASSHGTPVPDPMVWTVQNSKCEAGTGGKDDEETYRSLTLRLLNERLRPFGQMVVEPNEKEFVSQESRPYRTGEKAAHVKAHRGSKDGFLYFLPTGIAWVFKKPLAFFSFDSIVSVSYTSVLQRTFNLNILTRSSTCDETQEFEFSMVDQADFAGIDEYVKRHRLQDASMADQRRAKKLGINAVKGEDGADTEAEEQEGHLEKAAREAEELEDEDEEDDENFDPGSEGESEGSGSSGEEEEDDADNRGDGDLVGEELGSEAEDID